MGLPFYGECENFSWLEVTNIVFEDHVLYKNSTVCMALQGMSGRFENRVLSYKNRVE
jgi:hypothetical protein